ncbi:N-acetylneuraminate synthase [Rhodovulum sp. ES.010]|uniref:N-acetylneuraminate synthase family protein n=1 Tax=Rhodovulum sp. ES.010 TaxID=1882821 RepID=UPI0009287337|nr:N-acetylneuraminate synthase family protein [Rhodovulum sp. ES.010]SIO48591.1 N-acetylneuraminate synthase [Rhodovulum sp. ES.010]
MSDLSSALARFAPRGMPLFIAEAGVNHDGDPAAAMRLVEAAAHAGADIVKFQTWLPGEITGRFTDKVGYMQASTEAAESRYELSARLALPYDAHFGLKERADALGITFLSTPDGFQSLDFLVDRVGIPVIKVGSTEITHLSFLHAIGAKRLPVILSTGLSTLGEVDKALAALREGGATDITILHCTSEYPAPDAEMNLRAMETLRDAFGLPVGLSDHSLGPEAAIAATAMGASVIEKHFTLDRKPSGPDHNASMTADEMAHLIGSIRKVRTMLGDGVKTPTPSELANSDGIRRSVVAAHAIPAGTRLDQGMLTCKRPGGGIAPEHLDTCLGFAVNRDLQEDEPLHWEDLR